MSHLSSSTVPDGPFRWSIRNISVLVGIISLCNGLALVAGFYWFRPDNQENGLPELLAASASSSDTMAVATGPISQDAEGVFFLDFNTGDLQCLVYYPRYGAFGAHYYANVLPQLGGGGKNSKYIMVTGEAIPSQLSSNTAPGASLVYITDVTTGLFAAYAVPWNRTAESSGRMQSGPLVYVGGGPIRNYQLRDPRKNKPAKNIEPKKKK